MNDRVKRTLVGETTTVKSAMKQLEENSSKILFVVDGSGRLYGSFVDGDIRRWILSGGTIDAAVKKVCNSDPFVVTEPFDIEDVKAMMLNNSITSVPVVNGTRQIVDVLFWDSIFGSQGRHGPVRTIDASVVIMAGGKGTRLDPFTKILPKPLIPIGDKTLLELIAESFTPHGIDKFYISVNHKAKIIRSYFEELSPDYSIEYIEEDQPLGTAGSLKLLEGRLQGPIMVTNCDIIIRTDYADLLDFHRESDNDMTIVASMKTYNIPYGICEIKNGGALTRIVEKPEYELLVNTGMYVIEPEVLELIPGDRMFHMTDLVKAAIDRGYRTAVYPVGDNSWLDIGQWAEYKNSLKKLELELT